MLSADEKLVNTTQLRSLERITFLHAWRFVRLGTHLLFSNASLSRDVWWGVRRRLHAAFIELIPAYALVSAMAIIVGYWTLSETALRYGALGYIADIATQLVLLSLGHTLALVFLLLRLAPSAFLDVSARYYSGEMQSLQALRIDLDRFLVLPWMLAAPLAGLAFYSTYCALYFCISAAMQPVAGAFGIDMVDIDVVRALDYADFLQTAARVAIEALLIALFSIFFALHGACDVDKSPLALLRAIGAVRALNLILTALVLIKVISYLLL